MKLIIKNVLRISPLSVVLVNNLLLFFFPMFCIFLKIARFILSFILRIFRNSKLIIAVFLTSERENVCESAKHFTQDQTLAKGFLIFILKKY